MTATQLNDTDRHGDRRHWLVGMLGRLIASSEFGISDSAFIVRSTINQVSGAAE